MIRSIAVPHGAATVAELAITFVLIGVLSAIALYDVRQWRIPDALNAALFGLGVLSSLALDRLTPQWVIVSSVSMLSLGLVVRETFRYLRGYHGLGLGDVKFLAGAAALVGLEAMPVLVLLASVAALRLDDIDWQAGTVRIAKPKSRRTDVLPLPRETGRTISGYLVSERPQTANRAVFVRHVAPYDEPIGTGVVQRVVREAYRRCSLPHTRVHILRHSVASRLLSAGTPLKEIADVLRHRSLDTSAIYTKVDTARLTAVALPWPGSAA